MLSTLKVYVEAITASHGPIFASTIGRHLLVSHFLHSARWLRPSCRLWLSSWDLPGKMTLFFTLMSLKRVGDHPHVWSLLQGWSRLPCTPGQVTPLCPHQLVSWSSYRFSACHLTNLWHRRGCFSYAQSRPSMLPDTTLCGISPSPSLFALVA